MSNMQTLKALVRASCKAISHFVRRILINALMVFFIIALFASIFAMVYLIGNITILSGCGVPCERYHTKEECIMQNGAFGTAIFTIAILSICKIIDCTRDSCIIARNEFRLSRIKRNQENGKFMSSCDLEKQQQQQSTLA
jgi:hypothetical protein